MDLNNSFSRIMKQEHHAHEKCDLYGPELVVPETPEFVAAKVRELEREIDKLSNTMKEAYFLALEQEIKQGTNYVRNQKFLLAFLRADSFDVARAALRMVNFFRYKLDLFGLQKLPHPIVQDDLDDDDLKIMYSGFFHKGYGVDSAGRTVVFSRRDRLRGVGLLQDRYETNIVRVAFYLAMFAIEENEHSQRKGFVSVSWNFNCTVPLKEYRILYRSFFKVLMSAIPMRFAGMHMCYNNVIERLLTMWRDTMFPKDMKPRIKNHDLSPAECLVELSTKYGINVDTLPLSETGDFKIDLHLTALEIARQKEMFIKYTMAVARGGRREQPRALNRADISTTQTSTTQRSSNVEVRNIGLDEDCLMELNHSLRNIDMKVADDSNVRTSSVGTKDGSAGNKQGTPAEETLPAKLMEILQKDAHPDAIWWARDGTAFAIEKKKFPRDVLLEEFNGVKLDSFLRRLRRWGFRRLPDKGGNYIMYQHPLFQKDAPHLLKDWDLYEDEAPRKEYLPVKLMKILDSNIATDAIWWLNGCNSFAIDREKFSKNVLPKEFEGLKLDSFFRMLRRWGFQRVSDQGEEANVVIYQHACLSLLMECPTFEQEEEKKEDNFPTKLYKVLASNSVRDAIWWLDCGTAFVIEIEKFAGVVLAKEFNNIKFSSFLRSLKRWGFKKLSVESQIPNISVYQHPSFQQNSPHLLEKWGNKGGGSSMKKGGDQIQMRGGKKHMSIKRGLKSAAAAATNMQGVEVFKASCNNKSGICDTATQIETTSSETTMSWQQQQMIEAPQVQYATALPSATKWDKEVTVQQQHNRATQQTSAGAITSMLAAAKATGAGVAPVVPSDTNLHQKNSLQNLYGGCSQLGLGSALQHQVMNISVLNTYSAADNSANVTATLNSNKQNHENNHWRQAQLQQPSNDELNLAYNRNLAQSQVVSTSYI